MTKPTSESIVYLNGEYIASNQAKVSVLDRGFVFGDGVYEVIPSFSGHLLRLEQHLDRLNNSLNAVQITNPHNKNSWRSILDKILASNPGEDQSVYLQITRGAAKRDHNFPNNTLPTVFVMSTPLIPPNQDQLNKGVKAITLNDIRWQYCHIKSISLLPNILLRQQAADQSAAEAILIKDGEITEGAASNVFVVHNSCIMTPPKGQRLLPGVTRDLVVEIAHKNKLNVKETSISEDVLYNAEEIWITSSTKEVMPVTLLNDKPVGKGVPGPAWKKVIRLFQDYKDSLRLSI